MNNYKKAREEIRKAKNILLVTHYNPDGDALSSTCAMIEFLKLENKKYFTYCFDKIPFQFDFLPNIEKFHYGILKNFNDFDLIISLDCGSVTRTTLEKEIINRSLNQKFIEFDHHQRQENYADIEIRKSDEASTTCVIYKFFKENNLKINKNIANCILTGILTDTANFLYSATSKETINIASEMLLFGAQYSLINKKIWKNKTLNSIKLWGLAINNLKINLKYKIAISYLKNEDIEKYNVDKEELEGIPGLLSSLEDVKALLWLRETDNGFIKGSLRTNHPKIDISKLAELLIGGGHIKTAGFKIKGYLTITPKGVKIIT